MRLAYLSLDRLELAFVAKGMLKRAVRFTIAAPRLVCSARNGQIPSRQSLAQIGKDVPLRDVGQHSSLVITLFRCRGQLSNR
eukprot:1898395-Amphidinium_carterae.3